MARMPPVSGAQMADILRQAGFRAVGERGPHVKFRSPEGRTTVVPMHETLARGTQRGILRQAGLSRDAFARLHQPRAVARETRSPGIER
jgi:predicted RNA binding protein YcfA (HicA-like mRNA interferase family)